MWLWTPCCCRPMRKKWLRKVKTSSAKAKGRRACAELRDALLAAFTTLHEDDIRVTPSSVPGEDLFLSPLARSLFPFSPEVKNQEALNIWAAIKQAREHSDKSKEKHSPLVAFKRNGEPLRVILELEDFLKFLEYRNEVLNYPKYPEQKKQD
jgi:hypothetical protein